MGLRLSALPNQFANRLLDAMAAGFISLLALLTIVGLGFTTDGLLSSCGLSVIQILTISHFLSAAVGAGLGLCVIRCILERREANDHKMQTISEMNHHVRNALQVIVFLEREWEPDRGVGAFQQAVARIEWALEEVLPRSWNTRSAVQSVKKAVSTSSATESPAAAGQSRTGLIKLPSLLIASGVGSLLLSGSPKSVWSVSRSDTGDAAQTGRPATVTASPCVPECLTLRVEERPM